MSSACEWEDLIPVGRNALVSCEGGSKSHFTSGGLTARLSLSAPPERTETDFPSNLLQRGSGATRCSPGTFADLGKSAASPPGGRATLRFAGPQTVRSCELLARQTDPQITGRSSVSSNAFSRLRTTGYRWLSRSPSFDDTDALACVQPIVHLNSLFLLRACESHEFPN